MCRKLTNMNCKLISCPTLPKNTVKHALIGEEYTDISNDLYKLKINTIPLKSNKNLIKEISSHADMLSFSFGDKLIVSRGSLGESVLDFLKIDISYTDNIKSPYPNDVKLNGCILSKYLICNPKTVSNEILDNAKQKNLKIIETKQGYSKCSLCVVNDNAVITEDAGLAHLLKIYQFDVLLISPGSVYLSDEHYGFLGGSSAKISENEMYFSGDIEKHTDYHKILEFLNKYNIKAIYNKKLPLIDFGGLISLTEYC